MEQTEEKPKKPRLKADTATPTLTYGEVTTFNAQLNAIKNHGLTVASITSLIKLKAEIKVILTQFQEAVKAIFSKYGIEAENGSYNYEGHKDKKKINKDYADLLGLGVELNAKLNFIPMKEFAGATSDLDLGTIAELAEKLVVKEK